MQRAKSVQNYNTARIDLTALAHLIRRYGNKQLHFKAVAYDPNRGPAAAPTV
jgi:hypothetical protein